MTTSSQSYAFDWRARLRAALIHFGGSALVAAVAGTAIFLIWFPWPFSALAGGTGLFLLITGVDVVMGPVITFAIFNKSKGWPELRRDLVVVVLLQLAALGFGAHTMYAARPVVLALEQYRLRVVAANEVVVEELPQAPAALRTIPAGGPIQIRTIVPTESGEVLDAVQMALAGADLGTRPKYWRPWDDTARSQAKVAGQPMSELRKRFPHRVEELDIAIHKTGRTQEQLRYLPVLSRYADWIALIDATSGDIVGFAPFNGF